MTRSSACSEGSPEITEKRMVSLKKSGISIIKQGSINYSPRNIIVFVMKTLLLNTLDYLLHVFIALLLVSDILPSISCFHCLVYDKKSGKSLFPHD